MWQLFLHLPDAYLIGMSGWLLVLLLIPAGLIRLRRRWSGEKNRLRLVYTGLSAWLCLSLLTAIELGFALFYDTTDSFDRTNVSRRWFQVHVEPEVRALEFHDGSGIRYRAAEPFDPRPPRNVRHICFLGDSFTFGHGVADVEDRFSNELARLHTDAAGNTAAGEGTAGKQPPWRVSNLAWPGTDPVWGQAVLRKLFEGNARIDDAVYVICLNDIEAFHDPTLSRSTELGRFDPPTFLFSDTWFFNWLYFRTQLLLTRSESRGYYSFVRGYYQGEPWDRFRLVLEEMSVLCRSEGAQFRLVIFPFLHNLGDEYPFRPVHEQISGACRELNIPCLDLDEPLAAHADEGLTVNPFDAHPNELAHRIAAEALLEWLMTPADVQEKDAQAPR